MLNWCTDNQLSTINFLPDQMLARILSIFAQFVLFNVKSCMSDLGDLRMCYFQSSARNRGNIAKFDVKDIDFTLCTHYIYAHAIIDANTHKLVPSKPGVEDGPNGLYRQFVDGKKTMPSIKTMISVGTLYTMFGNLSANPDYVETFAASVVPFLNQRRFDGLDVDWVYPYNNEDKILLVSILRAIRSHFNKHQRSALILTSTVEAYERLMELGFKGVEIAKYVDYAIIKTQNITFAGQTYAHFHSPLFAKFLNSDSFMLSVNHSVYAANFRGMPYNKMVVGIALTGTLLQLENASVYEPGSNITRQITYGPLYSIASSLAYPEICQLMNSSVRYFDPIQKSPYLVRGKTWIGYEDRQSIQAKLDWLKTKGIAGIMIAALDHDDFTGTICNQGTYPLVSFLKSYQVILTTMPTAGFSSVDPIINATTTEDIKPEKKKQTEIFWYLALVPLSLFGCICLYLVIFCYRKRKGVPTAEEGLHDRGLGGAAPSQSQVTKSESQESDLKRLSETTTVTIESSVDY